MENVCIKASIFTLVINIFLSLIKVIAGFIGHSSAMISDGIHSLSDVLSTIIVIIGIYLSNKKSDSKHQYGHERLESVASLILSFILFVTGAFIGIKGFYNLYHNNFVVPTMLPIIAAILSIIVKTWMYIYTMRIANKYDSDAMKADAYHHKSDALSSIGSLVGIFATIKGIKFMDLIASIIISIIIIKTAIEIFIESIKKMIDVSCSEETEKDMVNVIMNVEGVLGIDDMKTRLFGNKINIDLKILADKDISFLESHNIAHMVQDKLMTNFPNIKNCMIHMNPEK